MTTSHTSKKEASEGPSHCGSKPKKIAIGIAPLGFISIGIVPMGIVTIGIVPMGVVSKGVVAMGVINASIVGMGIFSAGLTTMGLWVWSPEHTAIEKSLNSSNFSGLKNNLFFETQSEAKRRAKELKCHGTHKMGSKWMPCGAHVNID